MKLTKADREPKVTTIDKLKSGDVFYRKHWPDTLYMKVGSFWNCDYGEYTFTATSYFDKTHEINSINLKNGELGWTDTEEQLILCEATLDASPVMSRKELEKEDDGFI